MDYQGMAEELLSIRAKLLHVPANQMMNEFVRGELFVLNYLLIHMGTAYPKELSRGMSVSSARIAALLNQMEKKRWLVRTTDIADNRQIIITLTALGEQEIKRRREEIVDAVAKLLEKLGEDDARQLLRIQREIMNMENVMEA